MDCNVRINVNGNVFGNVKCEWKSYGIFNKRNRIRNGVNIRK